MDVAPDFDRGVGIDALAAEFLRTDLGVDDTGTVGELVHLVGQLHDDLAAQGHIGIVNRFPEDFGDVLVLADLAGADIFGMGRVHDAHHAGCRKNRGAAYDGKRTGCKFSEHDFSLSWGEGTPKMFP